MNTFQLLDSGDDILKIQKDIFTVDRFKELTTTKLSQKLTDSSISKSWYLGHLLCLPLSIIPNEMLISMDNLILVFPPEGINCSILKMGSKEWQQGKIRIRSYINKNHSTIELEFSPSLPIEPESPLDEIRRSPDYPQLS